MRVSVAATPTPALPAVGLTAAEPHRALIGAVLLIHGAVQPTHVALPIPTGVLIRDGLQTRTGLAIPAVQQAPVSPAISRDSSLSRCHPRSALNYVDA